MPYRLIEHYFCEECGERTVPVSNDIPGGVEDTQLPLGWTRMVSTRAVTDEEALEELVESFFEQAKANMPESTSEYELVMVRNQMREMVIAMRDNGLGGDIATHKVEELIAVYCPEHSLVGVHRLELDDNGPFVEVEEVDEDEDEEDDDSEEVEAPTPEPEPAPEQPQEAQ